VKQIVWFRRDLRTDDNPALSAPAGEMLPIFILDTEILKHLAPDDRRVGYIIERVIRLKAQLREIGLDLAVFYGAPEAVFEHLGNELGSLRVYASGDGDAYAKARDARVAERVDFCPVHDGFLLRPEHTLKPDGTPYRVFTPYYRSVLPALEGLAHVAPVSPRATLLPFDYEGMRHIKTGERLPFDAASIGFAPAPCDPALHRLPTEVFEAFRSRFAGYETFRDYPEMAHTTRIATALRFGTESIRSLFRRLFELKREGIETAPFMRQLVWREFYHMILHHFPGSETDNFLPVTVAWEANEEAFVAWCTGQTGVPLVDAAMRCLNQTGGMHNRLRMVAASFLSKNLLQDWRLGERYFAALLMDYEASSNVGSWQWAASTGADAVPYFRIFNPWIQAKKFDKDAAFIKRWVPELAGLPAARLHDEGWMAQNGVSGYPRAIVSTKGAKERFSARYHYAK